MHLRPPPRSLPAKTATRLPMAIRWAVAARKRRRPKTTTTATNRSAKKYRTDESDESSQDMTWTLARCLGRRMCKTSGTKPSWITVIRRGSLGPPCLMNIGGMARIPPLHGSGRLGQADRQTGSQKLRTRTVDSRLSLLASNGFLQPET